MRSRVFHSIFAPLVPFCGSRRLVPLIFFMLLICNGAIAVEANLLYLFLGNCNFMRSGWNNWLGVSPHQPSLISPGDTIKTPDRSYAELRTSDGSSINIKPETLITYTGNSVQIQYGEIWVHAVKQKTAFQIMTPKATCTILGTLVNVSVDTYGRTKIRTVEGLVSVRGNEDVRKRQLILQKGMMTTITDAKKTEDAPQKFNAGEASKELGATKMELPKKTRSFSIGH